MKIPKKIDVKGSVYTIHILCREHMPDADGLCNPGKQAIALADDLAPKDRDQIFLHELIHAVCDEVGLTQAHISDDAFEIIAQSISTFLCDRFTVNLKKGGHMPKGKPSKGGKKGGGKKGC